MILNHCMCANALQIMLTFQRGDNIAFVFGRSQTYVQLSFR
jgi:hypothetical protein